MFDLVFFYLGKEVVSIKLIYDVCLDFFKESFSIRNNLSNAWFSFLLSRDVLSKSLY